MQPYLIDAFRTQSWCERDRDRDRAGVLLTCPLLLPPPVEETNPLPHAFNYHTTVALCRPVGRSSGLSGPYRHPRRDGTPTAETNFRGIGCRRLCGQPCRQTGEQRGV